MDNGSLITFFILSGINETKNHRFAIFYLTLLFYCVNLLVNICLIVTIILDENLHEPMYVLICALFLNALYGTTGFYPKFLHDLLSPVPVISYTGCLVQALVMYSFTHSDVSILALMAYDRYLAICRPLEYHSILSKQKMLMLVCLSWLTSFCIIVVNTFFLSRLKLCSPYIQRLFCFNWVIVKLACFPAETTANTIIAYLAILIHIFHFIFIIWSYMCLIKTCLNSIENRAKFMQTCVPHLFCLITFLVTILMDIMTARFGAKHLPQRLQNLISIAILLIPPILNPFIYGFKLTKIRIRIMGFIHFKK